jgi:UDP-glucose 4-epimerase
MNDVVLVTGGAGAIGANLVRALINSGTTSKIVVVDDLSSGRLSNLESLDIEFIKLDISDATAVEKVFSFKPNKVYHLAALFANQNSIDHPNRDLSVNGGGLINVLNGCVKNSVKRVVYTSSSCVYGNLEYMIEGKEGQLDTPYAITKLLGEQYLEYYSRQYGIEALSARLFNSYGPFDYPGLYRSVIPNFFQDALLGKPLKIYGDGGAVRTYAHVEDLIHGLIGLMNNAPYKGSHEIVNLGSEEAVTSSSLALMINDITNNKSGVYHEPNRDWDHVHSRIPILDKARELIQYSPEIKIEEGLQNYHQWEVKTL